MPASLPASPPPHRGELASKHSPSLFANSAIRSSLGRFSPASPLPKTRLSPLFAPSALSRGGDKAVVPSPRSDHMPMSVPVSVPAVPPPRLLFALVGSQGVSQRSAAMRKEPPLTSTERIEENGNSDEESEDGDDDEEDDEDDHSSNHDDDNEEEEEDSDDEDGEEEEAEDYDIDDEEEDNDDDDEEEGDDDEEEEEEEGSVRSGDGVAVSGDETETETETETELVPQESVDSEGVSNLPSSSSDSNGEDWDSLFP
eukprot:scaffold13045_cov266-Ochromonas_danica.AAC.1